MKSYTLSSLERWGFKPEPQGPTYFAFCFWKGSHCVAQAGPQLLGLTSVLVSAIESGLVFTFILKNSRAVTTCSGFKPTPIFYRVEQPGFRGWRKRMATHRTPLYSTEQQQQQQHAGGGEWAASLASSLWATSALVAGAPSHPGSHDQSGLHWLGVSKPGLAFSPASQEARGQSLTEQTGSCPCHPQQLGLCAEAYDVL